MSAVRLLAAGTRVVVAFVGLLGVRRALAWARERSMAMMESIRRAIYIHEVGRLTDEVARATSSGYVRGLRAASFSTVRLVARASSRLWPELRHAHHILLQSVDHSNTDIIPSSLNTSICNCCRSGSTSQIYSKRRSPTFSGK